MLNRSFLTTSQSFQGHLKRLKQTKFSCSLFNWYFFIFSTHVYVLTILHRWIKIMSKKSSFKFQSSKTDFETETWTEPTSERPRAACAWNGPWPDAWDDRWCLWIWRNRSGSRRLWKIRSRRSEFRFRRKRFRRNSYRLMTDHWGCRNSLKEVC